jgi:hypothetical protein
VRTSATYRQPSMMMILPQVRHGRQDNHAINHVRCAETCRSAKHVYLAATTAAKDAAKISAAASTWSERLEEVQSHVVVCSTDRSRLKIHLKKWRKSGVDYLGVNNPRYAAGGSALNAN